MSVYLCLGNQLKIRINDVLTQDSFLNRDSKVFLSLVGFKKRFKFYHKVQLLCWQNRFSTSGAIRTYFENIYSWVFFKFTRTFLVFILSKFACKYIDVTLLICSRKISALFAIFRINTKVKATQKSDTIVLNMMSKLVIACNFHALKGLCQVKLAHRFCFDTEKALKVLKMKHCHDYLFSIPMETFQALT